jgi:glycogen(starch) synthase
MWQRRTADGPSTAAFEPLSPPGTSLHVLVTSDTLSAVWTYTRELVTGLVGRGVRVTLVSVGEIPLPEQTAWMDSLQGVQYHPTAFRLNWMEEGVKDYEESSAYLTALAQEVRPDLLHLNHVCYGNLPVDVPRLVVAHGDLISWWKAVHGCEPPKSRWLSWYRNAMIRGLSDATAVVAPTSWMLDTLHSCYIQSRDESVIYNGRNPLFFNPYVSKEDSVLAVGRPWDAGKQVSLLTQHAQSLPVCIVGSDAAVPALKVPIRAEVKLAVDDVNVAFKGPQNEAQMRSLYSRSAIYAATARYQPFEAGALDAAFSRSAIVANDIPAFRELWGDDALYFRTNDAASLAEVIQLLSEDRTLRQAYANRTYMRARERFTAKRMLDEYLRLYQDLIGAESAVA